MPLLILLAGIYTRPRDEKTLHFGNILVFLMVSNEDNFHMSRKLTCPT